MMDKPLPAPGAEPGGMCGVKTDAGSAMPQTAASQALMRIAQKGRDTTDSSRGETRFFLRIVRSPVVTRTKRSRYRWRQDLNDE
ncbi:MAG: hypothetical protein ABT10_23165 [Novosphingobium sp. SCN 63-17]|nr:MAG: hypothetical protein ABT10_23165 [Novosphingobium sp. SCN 63-17]